MCKTVAIITMHAVPNYGSALQTVALSKFLGYNGYNPLIVDYLFPNEYHRTVSRSNSPEVPKISWFKNRLNGICQRLLKSDPEKRLSAIWNFVKSNVNLTRKYLSLKELENDPVLADIYLTGSDQVWNPRYIGEDPTFFLSWVPKNTKYRKISYASSFGVKDLPDNSKRYISEYLLDYDFISVREENNILLSLGIKNCVTLDPTFLLDKGHWSRMISNIPIFKGKYILCYLLSYSYNPFPYAYKVVESIRKETGYNVVMIGAEPFNILKGYKLYNNCSPEEFLNLFVNASFVITTSFHGTAFAINFGIPFVTIIDNESTSDNRQINIVNKIGCNPDCILKKGAYVDNFLANRIMNDFNTPHLEDMRRESIEYLLNALK